MTLPDLSAVEQRVLGSLLEKQVTVPASYPLTLNSLRLACNQTSSREPVVDYDESLLDTTCQALKARGLVKVVWLGKGARTLKYHQLLDEVLALEPDERAILTVLLLRGPQSAGQLRTRTDRLHTFSDKDGVEVTLARLAERDDPLVRELPLQRGHQDCRWVHLLGEIPEMTRDDAPVSVDREVLLSAGAAARDAQVKAAFDAASQGPEAELDWLSAAALSELGRRADGRLVLDVGCGTGRIAAALTHAGVSACGIDFSVASVERAHELHPGVDVSVGNIGALLRPQFAAAWGGVVLWDVLGTFAPSELGAVFGEAARILDVDGWILVEVGVGARIMHVTKLNGCPVELDMAEHDQDDVLSALAKSGFVDVEWTRRSHTDGGERLIVFARKV